jgi:hypothetical protein
MATLAAQKLDPLITNISPPVDDTSDPIHHISFIDGVNTSQPNRCFSILASCRFPLVLNYIEIHGLLDAPPLFKKNALKETITIKPKPLTWPPSVVGNSGSKPWSTDL